MSRTAVLPSRRTRVGALALSIGLAAASFAVVATSGPSGAATTYNVTSGADSGPGSLRAAITQADADDVDAVIEIATGLAITITGAELEFSPATNTRTLTINGNGSTVTRTSGTGRFLANASTGALTVNAITLSGFGLTANAAQGGVIATSGAATLTGIFVAGTTNSAAADGVFGGSVTGGVVSAGGALTVANSEITGTTNEAAFGTTFAGSVTGGIFFADDGPITIADTAIEATSNTARALNATGGSIAGGIAFASSGAITLAGSSITGLTNLAETSPGISGYVAGGVFFTRAPVTITGSTIAGVANDAKADPGPQGFGSYVAGGIAFANGDITLTSSGVTNVANDVMSGGIFGGYVVGGAFFGQGGKYRMTGSVIQGVTNTPTQAIGTGAYVRGGAVFSQPDFGTGGLATLVDSTIRDIASTGSSGGSPTQPQGWVEGGALYSSGGVALTRSTVANSVATTAGSATYVYGAGIYAGAESEASAITIELVNSTVTGNVASAPSESRGGGIFTLVPLTLVYSDVVGNSAAIGANLAGSAEIVVPADDAATLAIFGTVITDPGGGGTNCADLGTVTSSGYNAADDSSCGLATATDIQSASLDPRLGALADNGGPTPTLLPASGSPLVDAIPAAACRTAPLASTVTTDQRGLPRPEFVGGRCDIGAVEVQPAPPLPPGIVPTFTG